MILKVFVLKKMRWAINSSHFLLEIFEFDYGTR